MIMIKIIIIIINNNVEKNDNFDNNIISCLFQPEIVFVGNC